MQTTIKTETLLYPRSAFSGVVRAAFRSQESGCGSAVLFTSPRFDMEVSWVAGCVAAELSHVYDRVLLADSRAILTLAQQDDVPFVERLPVRLASGRVWVLGRQQIRERADPAKRAAEGRATHVMRAFRSAFDHVVIDVSTLAGPPEMAELCREAEGTILVVRTGCTTEQEVLRCSRAVTEAGGKVLGSVLTA